MTMLENQSNQQGVALATGLVFMVIMTLIGISSLSLSQSNNIIVRNNQTQMQALNRTEILLKNGERDIDTITNNGNTKDFSLTGDHYHLNGTTDALSDSWSFTSQGSSSTGQYVIEYVGKRTLPGASSAWDTGVAGDSVYQFTITSKHELSNGARRLTESVYVTETAP